MEALASSYIVTCYSVFLLAMLFLSIRNVMVKMLASFGDSILALLRRLTSGKFIDIFSGKLEFYLAISYMIHTNNKLISSFMVFINHITANECPRIEKKEQQIRANNIKVRSKVVLNFREYWFRTTHKHTLCSFICFVAAAKTPFSVSQPIFFTWTFLDLP